MRRLLCVALLVPGLALAQAYPAKPVHLIFPTIPGSAFEVFGRLVGTKMGQSMGQPVVADNRPGANGAIGADVVAKAAPDGYTLLWATPSQIVMSTFLVKSLPFNPHKDFVPVSIGAIPLTVMVINPTRPFSTMKELIDYGRKNPGKLSFGSSGTGSVFHFMGAAFNQAAGIDMVHVPYKGPPQALADVMGGRVDATFVTLGTATPPSKAGKLRIVGILADKRFPSAPEIPTFSEVLPSYDVPLSWYALFGTGGTPRPIVTRLYQELAGALKSDEARAWLEKNFHAPGGNTPDEFAAQLERDFQRWGKAFKDSGVQPE